jgi:hypothetical protein
MQLGINFPIAISRNFLAAFLANNDSQKHRYGDIFFRIFVNA